MLGTMMSCLSEHHVIQGILHIGSKDPHDKAIYALPLHWRALLAACLISMQGYIASECAVSTEPSSKQH